MISWGTWNARACLRAFCSLKHVHSIFPNAAWVFTFCKHTITYTRKNFKEVLVFIKRTPHQDQAFMKMLKIPNTRASLVGMFKSWYQTNTGLDMDQVAKKHSLGVDSGFHFNCTQKLFWEVQGKCLVCAMMSWRVHTLHIKCFRKEETWWSLCPLLSRILLLCMILLLLRTMPFSWILLLQWM
jgi:hypothetical protein